MDHFVCTKDNSILPHYSELKKMNEINIEIPMLLNSDLIKRDIFYLNSKIIHLQFKNTSNNFLELKSGIGLLTDRKENHFSQERLFKFAFNHMVNCLVPLLKKNPVFFGVIKFETYDRSFLDEFEINRSIKKDEINLFRKNYLDTIDLINYLASDKLNSYEMGRKIWNINDLKI
jgi:hypothetical protein